MSQTGRRTLAISGFLAAFVIGSSLAAPALASPYIQAHRGGSLHTVGGKQVPRFPENTMPAFRHAAHRGFTLELDIKLTKDGEKLWVGFNDEKGRYQDNHLGKGRRHELDPLWVRVEVVRITVD